MEPLAAIFIFGCLVTAIVGTGMVFALIAFGAADSIEFEGTPASEDESEGGGAPFIDRL
jgi:hypothetical protein